MLYNVIWGGGGQKYDIFALYNIWMAPYQVYQKPNVVSILNLLFRSSFVMTLMYKILRHCGAASTALMAEKEK